MKIGIFLLVSFLFLLFTPSVRAIEDPTSVANNKYGIHIVDENDLNRARELVNSSGGDWGYVKVVIQESERSQGRWQGVFDTMRREHLFLS